MTEIKIISIGEPTKSPEFETAIIIPLTLNTQPSYDWKELFQRINTLSCK